MINKYRYFLIQQVQMYESRNFSNYMGVLYTNICIFVNSNFYNKNILS